MSSAPATGGTPLPMWLSEDWLPAMLTALVAAAGVVAVSLSYVLAVAIATDSLEGTPVAQVVGLVASIAFGAGFDGSATDGFSFAQFELTLFPLPLALVPAAAVIVVLQRLKPDLGSLGPRRAAFGLKVGLIMAFLSAAVCQVASMKSETEGTEVQLEPSGTRAFAATLVVTALAALVFVDRQRPFLRSWVGWAALWRPVSLASAAFGMCAAVGLSVSVLYSIINGDLDGDGFVGLLAIIVAAGASLGFGMATFGMVVPLSGSARGDFDMDGALSEEHVHLFSSGVPSWMKLLIVVAPVAVGVVQHLDLERSPATSQRELARRALRLGICFGAVVGVSTFFDRFTASVSADDGFGYLRIGFNVFAAVAGGLIWGLVGSVGAAYVWGQQRGVPLITTLNSPSAPPRDR